MQEGDAAVMMQRKTEARKESEEQEQSKQAEGRS